MPYCGDGIKDNNEQCDDGNGNNGDTCSNTCTVNKECVDTDHDGVCDEDDDCPNSHPEEPVDRDGCDIFQFCSKMACGPDCERADWRNNEDTLTPKDCKTLLPLANGIPQQPGCVPTVFNQICAN